MNNNKEKLLDYQEFHDMLVEQEYIPTKIDYGWIDANENFMRDVLFSFYSIYSRKKDSTLLHPLFRLYSDVVLSAYMNYPEEDGYL